MPGDAFPSTTGRCVTSSAMQPNYWAIHRKKGALAIKLGRVREFFFFDKGKSES